MPSPLPPLNAVRAFEVAARCKTFARAAEELGVTQGAVSKQVIALEDYIGAQLFERLPAGLSLTEEGKALQAQLTPAFASIEDAFTQFRRRPPRDKSCRISTISSFASEVLTPRLCSFEKTFPDIALTILSSDRLLDLTREEIDFSIRYGAGAWAGVSVKALTPGRLAPVCAPQLLDDISGDAKRALCCYRRIQIFPENEWAAAADIDLFANASPGPYIMRDFVVALAAATAGQGIALLPEILTRKAVKDGRLAYLSNIRIDWPQTYYLAYAPGAERNAQNRAIMDWLIDEIQQTDA